MSGHTGNDDTALRVTLVGGGEIQGFNDTAPLAAVSPAVTGQTGDRAPVSKWLGIPYGEPGRWQRISEPVKWQGVKECFEFGPIPMQPLGVPLEGLWDVAPGYHLRTHIPQSENCLSTNIFRPASSTAGEKLPVFVFIYGGALRIGCSTKIRHDPTELVRHSERIGKPIVVVTFNYRVGIFGWLNHPDMTDEEGICGNFGLHDQLYFFRWLQRNISKFGGDPSRITAMGNSAGAFSIAALMTRQRKDPSETLFSNAIFESGAPCTMSWRSRDSFFPYYDKMIATAGTTHEAPLSHRLEALRALTSEQLMAFEGANFPFGNYGVTEETGSSAVFDAHPFLKLKEGDWDPAVKAIMIGCVEHEGSLSGAPLKINTPEGHLANIERFPEALRASLRELYPVNKEVESTVTAPGNRLLAHHIFTGPAYHLARIFGETANKEAKSVLPTYVFRFNTVNTQVNPDAKWGVHHTSELAFVFNTDSLWPAGSPEAATAEEVGRRWIDFMYTGKPGAEWPTFRDDTQLRLAINTGGETVVEAVKDAPDQPMLHFWHTVMQEDGPEAIRIRPLEQEFGKAGLGETVCA